MRWRNQTPALRGNDLFRGKALAVTGVPVTIKPMKMVSHLRRIPVRREQKAKDRTRVITATLQWLSGYHQAEALFLTASFWVLSSFATSSSFTLRLSITINCTTHKRGLHGAYVPFEIRIRSTHCSQHIECPDYTPQSYPGGFSPPSFHSCFVSAFSIPLH